MSEDIVKTRSGLKVTLYGRNHPGRPYVGEIEGFPGKTFTWDSCGNIEDVSLDHSPFDLDEDVWRRLPPPPGASS